MSARSIKSPIIFYCRREWVESLQICSFAALADMEQAGYQVHDTLAFAVAAINGRVHTN